MNIRYEKFMYQSLYLLVQIDMQHETVWLNIAQCRQLFQCSHSQIQRPMKRLYRNSNIYPSDASKKERAISMEYDCHYQCERERIRLLQYYNLNAVCYLQGWMENERAKIFIQWAYQQVHK